MISQDSEQLDFVIRSELEAFLSQFNEKFTKIELEFSQRMESVELRMGDCISKVSEISTSHGLLSGFYHKKKRDKSSLLCEMLELRDRVSKLQGVLLTILKTSLGECRIKDYAEQ